MSLTVSKWLHRLVQLDPNTFDWDFESLDRDRLHS